MWVMVMFDLPTDTKRARKRYGNFRKLLLKEGFQFLQYSVYGRVCPSDENAQVRRRKIVASLPVEGQVRILMFTDKQYERMEVFNGKIRDHPESPPQQMSFF